MKKWYLRMLVTLVAIFGILFITSYAYIQQPKFGALPEGKRLERIVQSPHYVDGKFQNLVPAEVLTGKKQSSFSIILTDYILNPAERLTPAAPIPAIKTDLSSLNINQDLVVWLGHSSFYIQLSGQRVLIDPVFSASAAPIDIANRAFSGTSTYSANDMPDIDYLLISHDHWDHLDYPTVKALQPKIRNVIAGLGMGAHFERWGFPDDKIHELDWYDAVDVEPGVSINAIPARHYSGRFLSKDQALWAGYALVGKTHKLLFSGDTGYGPHFAEIGKRFNGFDLVALDMGQYDARWANIHMFPEEAAQAAVDLKARTLVPEHVGKFSIARHAWDEPFNRIVKASQGKPYRLLSPKIGEVIYLDQPDQAFSRWWEGLDSCSAGECAD